MDIRQVIRKIIKESEEESEKLQMEFGDIEKAKRGIIALSKGIIPSSDYKVKFSLGSQDPYETGSYSQEGEVELNYSFEGVKYDTIISITADFYFKQADFQGDYWQPADEDEYEAEEIFYDEDEIIIGDEERNEYDIQVSDLGPNFKRDLEKFLFDYYDPQDHI
jgi:hypothetical protein